MKDWSGCPRFVEVASAIRLEGDEA